MKDNITILKILTYVILVSSATILLNDIREFDFQQFESFIGWAKNADKNENWFTSKNALKWSYYVISAAIFFFRGYLIYGFTYLIQIFIQIEKGNLFTQKNIGYFKIIGSIFITYSINIIVLKYLLAFIEKGASNFLKDIKQELTFLILSGLAFYLLAEIFRRAKQLKEENDLTI